MLGNLENMNQEGCRISQSTALIYISERRKEAHGYNFKNRKKQYQNVGIVKTLQILVQK